MSKPEYIYIDSDKIQIYKDDEKKVKVIAGKFKNVEGKVKKHNIKPIYLDIEIKKNATFSLSIPLTHNTFIYLIKGEVKIGDKKHEEIKNSTLIVLEKGEKLNIKGTTNSKFLLISGKPIGETIARGGPFVMNTKEEIINAIRDYNNGTFIR